MDIVYLGSDIIYVQGLNVICGVFLYVMPELDAFACLSKFVKELVPLYFSPRIVGAYAGLKVGKSISWLTNITLLSI